MARVALTTAVALQGVTALVGPPSAQASTSEVPGIITTVAGGAGEGLATAIAGSPLGVAVHGSTLYWSDRSWHAVRAMDLDSGETRVVAGVGNDHQYEIKPSFGGDGGPATAAQLNQPAGVAVDAAGNLYIADMGNHRVRRVDQTGMITTVAGTGVNGLSGDGGLATLATLDYPGALAVDRGGDVYIADTSTVRRVNALGIITRVAGNGEVTSSSGDGGPAVAAGLQWPLGITFDTLGNLYIAGGNRVRRVSPLGIITTFAGGGSGGAGDGGQATAAYLFGPYGLGFDTAGNLFIADALKVRRVDPAGVITTVAGTDAIGFGGDGGPARSATFAGVHGLAIDTTDNMYLADYWNHRIRMVDAGGTITSVAGNDSVSYSGEGGPATSAQVVNPNAVAARPDGTVYFSTRFLDADRWWDRSNARVHAVSPAGTIATVAGNGALPNPPGTDDGRPAVDVGIVPADDVAVDPAGNVHFASQEAIFKIDGEGRLVTVAGGGASEPAGGTPAGAAEVHPSSLAFDGAGNLYFLEAGSGRVGRIDRAGAVTTVVAPGRGLYEPTRIAVDRVGNVYIADTGRHRVVKADRRGNLTTVAGTGSWGYGGDGGPGRGALLAAPRGLAVDAAGNVFIADTGNDRIRKVDRWGTITTVAGIGRPGLAGDGGPATTAMLSEPRGLALDAAGNLLVADSWNNRVRRIAGMGTTTPPPMTPSAWGWNENGQLGDGTTTPRHVPADAIGAGRGAAVSAGAYHSLALGEDGRARSWGRNNFGQLGDRTATDRDVPVAVHGPDDLVAASAGFYHSLALRADGTVWAWGWNPLGQLGDGTTLDRTVPVRVVGLSDVVSISAGAFHSVAVTGDGTVWTWGWNGVGLLGDGTATGRVTPGRVAGSLRASAVAAGYLHTVALATDGTVWTWGWNPVGQLGDGSTGFRPVPFQLPLSGVQAVAAGALHSMALSGDGSIRAWGWNALGQLGDGTTTDRHAPVRTAGPRPAVAIAAGGYHSLAVGAGGVVSAWGWGAVGQLGTAGPEVVPVPIDVPGFVAPPIVSAGLLHSLSIRTA